MTTKGKDAVKATEGSIPTETEAAVARGINAFIDTHLRNSEFSRDTTAWNHFQAGLPVLIGSIVAELEV